MTSIEQAYEDLSPDAASALRRLGLLPVRVVDPDVTAAVCDVDRAEAIRLLVTLSAANFLQDLRTDRERERGLPMECQCLDAADDVVRARADSEPRAVRDVVLRRWVEWSLFVATRAEARLSPGHRTMPRTATMITSGPPLFTEEDDRAIVRWLERHRGDLLTAVRTAHQAEWWDLSWQIVDALHPLLKRGGHEDALALHRDFGLPAARNDQNRAAVRRMLNSLAGYLCSAGMHDEALEGYEQALAGAWEDSDRRDEAQALHGMGRVHRQAGRHRQAGELLLAALHIAEKHDFPYEAALTRLQLGDLHTALGTGDEALDYLTEARSALLDSQDSYDAAIALALLGRAYNRTGDYTTGMRLLGQAGEEFADTCAPLWAARTVEWLGTAARRAGRIEEARWRLTASRVMYAAAHSHQDADRLDHVLEDLDRRA